MTVTSGERRAQLAVRLNQGTLARVDEHPRLSGTRSERIRALLRLGLECLQGQCRHAEALAAARVGSGTRGVGRVAVEGGVVVDGSLVYPAPEVVVPVGEGSQAIGDASWEPA